MTKMLTTQCTFDETDTTWPVKFPGWHGNCDLWASINPLFVPSNGTRNLAIHGLFRYIDPAGAEATTLMTAGYAKKAWGSDIVANVGQYTTNKGYTDAYYEAGVPSRYLLLLSSGTISKSNELITNGYGFARE
jgi:hypothetical protein